MERQEKVCPELPKYLLIKEYGCGLWADLDHVLGQLMVAEMLKRIPVVYWGPGSLYYNSDGKNAFEYCFLPVSCCSINEIIKKGTTFYPLKWNSNNIYEIDRGKYSRLIYEEILNLFSRNEDIIVSDGHVSLEVILKYLKQEHDLYGCGVLQVMQKLYAKYIKVQPEVQKDIDDFYCQNMRGKKLIAVHVRAGDRTESREKLKSNNELYYAKISEFSSDQEDYAIFLLTDGEYVLQEFKNRYGERLIYTKCRRSNNNQGLHLDTAIKDRAQLCKEAVIDVYLAGRCDFFIGCRSNVSGTVLKLKEWDTAKRHLFMECPSTTL